MDRKKAQKTAIQVATLSNKNVAVIYSLDGEDWEFGAWDEARYLDICGPFPPSAEIWFCPIRRIPHVWESYQTLDEVAKRNAAFNLAWATGDLDHAVEVLKRYRREFNES